MTRLSLIVGSLGLVFLLSGCGSEELSLSSSSGSNEDDFSITDPSSEEQGLDDFNDDEGADIQTDNLSTDEDETIETVFINESTESEVEEEQLPARLKVMGESGLIDLDHNEVVIEFEKKYKNPVVFLLGSSWNGSDAARPQVKSVGERSAVVFLKESPNHDGVHLVENLSYLVLEAGLYELPNRQVLEVGKAVAHMSVGKRIREKKFQRQNFQVEFDSSQVVVLSQLQTNDKDAFASVRMRSIGKKGFDFALELEESAEEEYGRGEVGYLAVVAHAGESNRTLYEFGRMNRSVSHRWAEVLFENEYDEAPLFQAQVSSYYGGNSVQVRYDGLDPWGVDLFLEEDQSWDDEQRHVEESISYVVFEKASKLKAYSVSAEDL